MSQLTRTLSQYWSTIQGTLFPWLEEELDPLTKKQQQLIEILELIRIEEFIPDYFGCEGRPQKTRSAIARSFVAKMVYNTDTTTFLIQVAIPLATLSKTKVTNCYDLMDAAYDVSGIFKHSNSLGHVPLIDQNPRGDKALGEALEAELLARKTLNWSPAEQVRYNARSAAERVNARLKDEFGACKIRVRGQTKVTCHLMFGVLVLAADQIMKLVT